ncbi:MAG: putative GRX1-glutaredoxin [Benjaminiella poitrasii]|nr:MAG: putative GRX1-glutaredoxin [Benjaminiella poitrasii]
MASSSKKTTQENASQMVDDYIKSSKVMVFSKTYCPYCDDAKELLNRLKVKYEHLELDDMGAMGRLIQEDLLVKTGQWTVPNIFINQQPMGGCDDLHRLHSSGQLDDLLTK